jgi:hypothetical protein
VAVPGSRAALGLAALGGVAAPALGATGTGAAFAPPAAAFWPPATAVALFAFPAPTAWAMLVWMR